MGYNIYQYGQQQYGWGEEVSEEAITQFRILYAVATSFTTVRFEYSEAPGIADVPSLISPYGKGAYSEQPYGLLYQETATIASKSALNEDNYTITGPDGNLTITTIRAVSSTIFEATVSGMVSETNYTLTASEYIANATGTTNLADTIAVLGYGNTAQFVGFGVYPYVTSVINTVDGVLDVGFNEAMTINFAFRNVNSYTVSPLVNAPHVYLQSVVVDEETPSRVGLTFLGGGEGQYALVVHGLTNTSGLYIVSRLYYFTIRKYVKDELVTTTDYYFETNLGAVRLSMGTHTSRKIEDLAILKAQDAGYEYQFQNIAKALDKAGVKDDDRTLKLFKR